MVLLHVVRGLDFFRFPGVVQCKAVFGIFSNGIPRTWPSHLERCCFICVEMKLYFLLQSRFFFVTLFGQKIWWIFLRQLLWNVSTFCMSLCVILQHSDAYWRTDLTLTLLLSNFSLVKFCYFQIGWSLWKAVRAFDSPFLLHCHSWLCFRDSFRVLLIVNIGYWICDSFSGLQPLLFFCYINFKSRLLGKGIQGFCWLFFWKLSWGC